MSHRLNPKRDFKDLTENEKESVIAYFKNNLIDEKAFYEIISFGDCDLLERYIDDNSFGDDKILLPSVANELKKHLFNCYNDLKVKRVPIAPNIREQILMKLVKLHFLCKVSPNDISKFKENSEELADYFKRVQSAICDGIKELSEKTEQDNTFLFLCSYLARKINVAKKLFKLLIPQNRFDSSFSKTVFPWEQIQFILSIYVYSFEREYTEEDQASLYVCVLSKEILIKHLNNFLSDFELFNLEIKNAKKNCCNDTFNSNLKKDENSNAHLNDKEQEWEAKHQNLFDDFWLVKNIYSLKIINDHIDLALSVDFDSDSEIGNLTLDRCLLIIGEFIKCTPESPHLSKDLKFLLISLTPKDLQNTIKQIRDDLSHFQEPKFINKQAQAFLSKNACKRIQEDLVKIKDNFKFILDKEKYKVLHQFAQKLKKFDTVFKIFQTYPEHILGAIIYEINELVRKFDSITLSFIKDKVNKLKNEVSDANTEDREVIEEVDTLISTEKFDNVIFKTILKSLAYHLSYLRFVRQASDTSMNYKLLLNNLIDNLHTYSNSNDETFEYLGMNIHRLLEGTKSKNIGRLAMEIYIYTNVDLKVLKGFKYFKRNVKNNKSNKKIISIFESQKEIDKILSFLKENLNTEEAAVNFEDKVNKEIAVYKRKTESIDIVRELIKNSDKSIELEPKIKRLKHLIGDQNADLSMNQIKILDALTKRDFKLCDEYMKKKYKGKKKSKYEVLVKAFGEPDKSSLEAKVKLVSDFLNQIDCTNLCYKNFDSTANAIVSRYLMLMNTFFDNLSTITSKKQCIIDDSFRLQLNAAEEMVIIRILEVAHKFAGAENKKPFFSLRPDVLLYCGKSLRNYLAHLDLIYKVLLFDPNQILTLIALEMSQKGVNWLPEQNYFIHMESTDCDSTVEETYDKRSRSLASLQDRMFESIKKDNLDELKECIDKGAEPKGTDGNKRNALQLAFEKSSMECFKYLMNRYPKIIVCSSLLKMSQFYPYKSCITLDITTLPSLVKAVKLILMCRSSENKTNIDKVEDVNKFINDKFTTWFYNAKIIVDYFHIMVYLRDFNLIRNFCNLGINSVLRPDVNGGHPIHWAAGLGFQDMCEILLEYGADLNKRDNNGHSPLDIAIMERQWKVVIFLMKREAEKYIHMDPIILAAMTQEKQWIDELLKMHPFFEVDGSLNIFLFGYALFNCDNSTAGQLFSSLSDFNEITSIDFAYFKTKLLSRQHFYQMVYGFILSSACFIGRMDIVEQIFNFLEDQRNTSETFTIDCTNLQSLKNEDIFIKFHDLDILEFFRSNSLLHLACRGMDTNLDLIQCLIEKGFRVNETNLTGFLPFHIALIKGNIQICKYLIHNHQPGLNLSTPTGFTPIHISSIYGYSEITKELLDQQVRLDVLTKETSKTPLHLAACKGNKDVIQYLLEKNSEYIIQYGAEASILDSTDSQGNTALYLACLYGNVEVVEKLLDKNANILICNHRDATVIHAAVSSNNEDVVKLVINSIPVEDKLKFFNQPTTIVNKEELIRFVEMAEADKNSTHLVNLCSSFERPNLAIPLHIAASAGNNEIIKLLIMPDTDIDQRNSLGKTALHNAALEGNYDVACTLLSSGCQVDTSDCSGNTPLSLAVRFDHSPVVSLLLQRGANVNHSDLDGDTPMSLAARYGSTESANILISHKSHNNNANIDIRNKQGFTPIMIATCSGNLNMIKLLLDNKAKIDLSTWENPLTVALQNGFTDAAIVLLEHCTVSQISNKTIPFLQYAIYKNNLIMVEMLLVKGVSSNFKNTHGFHPLHLATAEGHLECMKILVKYKADLDARGGPEFFTPLHFAVQSSQINITTFLLEEGANANSYGRNFETPLYMAVKLGNCELVQILINFGAKTNVLGPFAIPLFFAVLAYENIDIIRILLESDNNLRTKLKHESSLTGGIMLSNRKTASQYFSHLHKRDGRSMYNLLSFKDRESSQDFVRKETIESFGHTFENNDDDLNHQNNHLHKTRSFSCPFPISNTEIVQKFVKNKNKTINVFTKEIITMNCHEQSREKYFNHECNNLSIQNRLIKCSSALDITFCDEVRGKTFLVNLTNLRGETPLHCAAAIGNVDIGTLLINSGADINATTPQGITPLDFALIKKNDRFVTMLRQHKIKSNVFTYIKCYLSHTAIIKHNSEMIKLINTIK